MEHLYIICYDIRKQRRWRKVYKTLQGYGEWMQLSVFQCRLSRVRAIQLEAALHEIVHHEEDHVLIVDLGPADMVKPKVQSIGRPFSPPVHESVIV